MDGLDSNTLVRRRCSWLALGSVPPVRLGLVFEGVRGRLATCEDGCGDRDLGDTQPWSPTGALLLGPNGGFVFGRSLRGRHAATLTMNPRSNSAGDM